MRQKNIITLSVFLLSASLLSGCAGLINPFETSDLEAQSNERAQEQMQFEEMRLSQAMTQREITVGMKKSQVLSLWGHPTHVETAGHPDEENERWIYEQSIFRSLSSTQSQPRARVIYFENGRIAGWETL